MTTKHTPAPWSVKDGQFHFVVESETGVDLAEIEKIFDEGYFENCKANAKLIAAAPDLLEALYTVQELIFKPLSPSYNAVDNLKKILETITTATENATS